MNARECLEEVVDGLWKWIPITLVIPVILAVFGLPFALYYDWIEDREVAYVGAVCALTVLAVMAYHKKHFSFAVEEPVDWEIKNDPVLWDEVEGVKVAVLWGIVTPVVVALSAFRPSYVLLCATVIGVSGLVLVALAWAKILMHRSWSRHWDMALKRERSER